MMLDLPEERGGAEMDLRWGDYRDCHFPLFSFLKPPSYAYIGLLYGMMWLGEHKKQNTRNYVKQTRATYLIFVPRYRPVS